MKIFRELYICVFLFIVISSYSQQDEKQDYFNFNNETLIKRLGVYEIDSITNSKIIFNKAEGDLTDKILYDNRQDEFNFNGTYKLTHTKTSKIYYFKFGWQNYNLTNTVYSSVNWLKDTPNKFGEFFIDAVELPFIQSGNISVCTIGDSQTWWSQGRYLRKFMNELNNDFIFVGSNQDVYGYGHEGEGGNHTKDVVRRLAKIPFADVYTVLLGTNDYNGEVNTSFDNLTIIVEKLIKRNPNAIVLYVTPLPTTNEKRDNFNLQLKEMFLNDKIKKNKIRVVYLGEYIRSYDNWKQFFTDGLHPNKLGYHIIATYLTLQINNWTQKLALKN